MLTHNITVIHENIELSGPTRAAMFGDESARGPLMLQGDHGPVAYRNIRIRPLNGSQLLPDNDMCMMLATILSAKSVDMMGILRAEQEKRTRSRIY